MRSNDVDQSGAERARVDAPDTPAELEVF